jgi:ribulose-phosphate 3-epimerase
VKKLAASILSADFGRLTAEVQALEAAGIDWIHVDVMDGHFVPNITIGPDVVRAIRKITRLPLDVHLMISNPDRYLEAFVDAGANWLGVHVEATTHLHRTVQRIKELKVQASVALNPATPLNSIEYVLPDLDMVLIMTVNPGFGGQEFIPAVLSKVRQLRQTIDDSALSALIAVDGGVNPQTVDLLVAAGVDIFVSGSAVFEKGYYATNIQGLKERIRTVQRQ